MVDPVRIGNPARYENAFVNYTGANPQSVRFDCDFAAEAAYIVNLQLQQSQKVFGVPRTIFIDNGDNPNTVEVTVTGTQFSFSIPAYANGYFPIDAQLNDELTFYSLGGATEKVRVQIFNYVIPPGVWYTTDPLAPGFDVQAVTPIATSITNRNTALLAGVAVNVFPAVATPRNCRFTNRGAAIVWYHVNATATGSFAAGDKQLNPGQYLELPYRTGWRISFFCAANANVEAEEWTVS